MQSSAGHTRPPTACNHLLTLLPRLSASLDGEATLALLSTTHTVYHHYTEAGRRASLRWHWFESPARYTEAFWEAFRARWPDTNVGTLTLWLTSASNRRLPTLFERPTPWPSLTMLQLDASTRDTRFVIAVNVWVLHRACPALRTVLLRGQVELTTLRMQVPITAIPVWAPECWTNPTAPSSSSLPRQRPDETLPWTTVHCLELPLPGAQDSFGWLTYASHLEELWVEYRLSESPRTMALPLHAFDLPSTCHTLRLSGRRAVFKPEHGTDTCLLLTRGLMLGNRHCLRTLAFSNVVYHVLNTHDLPTLRTVELDNSEGAIDTAVGGLRIETWDFRKDPPLLDEGDAERYIALIAAGRFNLYTARTVLGLSVKQWGFLRAHEGMLRAALGRGGGEVGIAAATSSNR